MNELPPSTSSDGSTYLQCPWCRDRVDDVKVRLKELMQAYHDRTLNGDALERADRKDWPAEDRLEAHCDSCARPFVVALYKHNGDRVLELSPIRTVHDHAYLQKLRHGETQDFEEAVK